MPCDVASSWVVVMSDCDGYVSLVVFGIGCLIRLHTLLYPLCFF